MSVAPVMSIDGRTPIYNEEMLDKYWDMIHPHELAENETIRVVRQIKEDDGSYGKFGMITEQIQIRTVDELKTYINTLQQRNPTKQVGVSISTAVFEYKPNQRPTIATFKRTKTIALDIDTHKKGTKERHVLGAEEESSIRFALLRSWIAIAKAIITAGVKPPKPKYGMLTGGGLQVVLEFEKELNPDEAKAMFGLLKNAIGSLKWNASIMNTLLSTTISSVDLDIDSTFADISHVQRAAGVINQKYGILAREIRLFDMTETELAQELQHFKQTIDETNYPTDRKSKFKEFYDSFFTEYNQIIASSDATIEVKENLMTAKMQAGRKSIRPSDLQSVEYELLIKIKEAGVKTLDLLQGNISTGLTTGNLTKLYCPFHEESNPSMAFYENELIDVFRDFHDDTTYNLISFWEKLFDVSKSEAITKLTEMTGIKLGKTERKDFQNLEIAEIVNVLLDRVNTEDFVYYRLANKNRVCVVRHIDSGECFLFDGSRMLASHVLSNQLNVYDAEAKLAELFISRFEEKILIEAFEEFQPGKPTVFEKQFIKFVNMWVPSNNYKKVHENVKENLPSEEFEIQEAIKVIKRKCPWSYKYILQLVQKGDIEWFINWMSAVSKFKVMPTVPVVFGVQGAGKNLFVSTIMDFYLNNEYVKVLNGDRIMSNFNSVLETASLIVLDEGDFSTGKEVDQLKLLTGNDKILVEKKGIDAVNKERHFNFLFFSNGEVPVRHPAMDRRITYFKNEYSLLRSCETWGVTIDELVGHVKEELVDLWAIIYKTKLDHGWTMANKKNGQFWEQIMKMHPFGNLIMKLIKEEWQDIALQINENVSEPASMQSNLELLKTIREQFNRNGQLSLTLINRYLQSMNYKVKTSIQAYIQLNHLDEFGINILVESDDVKIVIDKKKVTEAVTVRNLLQRSYPGVAKGEDNTLAAESLESEVEVLTSTFIEEDKAELIIPGLDVEAPPPPPLS